METVIALPLYLLLIGGVMWEGQLIYDKQKMVMADRYAAWNLGNRWRSPEWNGDPDVAGLKLSTEIQQKFFPDRSLDGITLFTPSMPPESGWIWQSSAGMQVTAYMPVWALGPIYAGVLAYQASPPETNAVLTGRDLPDSSGDYIGHVILMRTDNPDPRASSVSVNDSTINELQLSEAYQY